MDYKTFENIIISKVERNKDCNKTIINNKILINKYFNVDGNLTVIKGFVDRLNDAILKAKKYDAVKKLLKEPCMSKILNEFRESTILVRACKERNKKACKWLLTMDINPIVRDEKGKIALMYASDYWSLEDVAEKISNMDKELVNITDNDGNTALFYSVKIKNTFEKLVKLNINTNYKNKNGDTIFTHVCRHHKPKLLNSLIYYHKDIDFAVVNNDGKTGAMYLAESDNYTKLRQLYFSGVDLNLFYKNKNNETIVSHTINRIYDRFKHSNFHDKYVDHYTDDNFKNGKDYKDAKLCARTINALIDIGCDFNCIVDGDGNTPMSFFLMIKDYVSAINLLRHCKTMDLNICNKYGVSAAYIASHLTKDDFSSLNNIKEHLFVEISYKKFQKELINYPSFNSEMLNEFNDIPYCEILPYAQPDRVLSLQAALSEGYLARNGEDGNPDLFDRVFGTYLIINDYLDQL